MAIYKTKNDENVFKQCRIQSGFSQKEVAEKLGIVPSTVSKWESGTAIPDQSLLPKLADFFGVTVDFLLGRSDSPISIVQSDNVICLPIIGSVRAGADGNIISEDTGDTRIVPSAMLHGHPEEYFVLRVRGDSMYPEIIDGDCVLVRKTSSVDSGTMAVVLYDGELATVKWVKYVNGEDWVDLIPNNPTHPPIHIAGADLQECRILGEVVDIMRTPKKRNW